MGVVIIATPTFGVVISPHPFCWFTSPCPLGQYHHTHKITTTTFGAVSITMPAWSPCPLGKRLLWGWGLGCHIQNELAGPINAHLHKQLDGSWWGSNGVAEARLDIGGRYIVHVEVGQPWLVWQPGGCQAGNKQMFHQTIQSQPKNIC